MQIYMQLNILVSDFCIDLSLTPQILSDIKLGAL